MATIWPARTSSAPGIMAPRTTETAISMTVSHHVATIFARLRRMLSALAIPLLLSAQRGAQGIFRLGMRFLVGQTHFSLCVFAMPKAQGPSPRYVADPVVHFAMARLTKSKYLPRVIHGLREFISELLVCHFKRTNTSAVFASISGPLDNCEPYHFPELSTYNPLWNRNRIYTGLCHNEPVAAFIFVPDFLRYLRHYASKYTISLMCPKLIWRLAYG